MYRVVDVRHGNVDKWYEVWKASAIYPYWSIEKYSVGCCNIRTYIPYKFNSFIEAWEYINKIINDKNRNR